MSEVQPARLVALARLVDQYLDQNTFAETGRLLWQALASGSDEKMSQLRGLQNVVYSATRFSDIIDFIKNQMGKESSKPDRKPRWTKEDGGEMVGSRLLRELGQVRNDAAKLAAELGVSPDDPHFGTFPIALRLARGWVRHVAAHYLYCTAKGNGGS